MRLSAVRCSRHLDEECVADESAFGVKEWVLDPIYASYTTPCLRLLEGMPGIVRRPRSKALVSESLAWHSRSTLPG